MLQNNMIHLVDWDAVIPLILIYVIKLGVRLHLGMTVYCIPNVVIVTYILTSTAEKWFLVHCSYTISYRIVKHGISCSEIKSLTSSLTFDLY